MANDDKYLNILDKISEISVQNGRIDQRCTSIEKELSQIHLEDQRTNQLLEEHILNTKTNTERLSVEREMRNSQVKQIRVVSSKLDSRLEDLEKYPQFFKSLKTIAKYVTAIGTAAIVVTKILGFW